jgi:hypothetical protein
MTWQFCDNDDCPESWHWMDPAGTPEGCRGSDEAADFPEEARPGGTQLHRPEAA